MRELHIYIYYGTSVTQAIIASYGHKREIVYCAFSWLTLRAVYVPFQFSELQIYPCDFYIAQIQIEKYSKAPKQERDKLIVSSTARGAAKNVIKIDVLLIEPVTIEAATL